VDKEEMLFCFWFLIFGRPGESPAPFAVRPYDLRVSACIRLLIDIPANPLRKTGLAGFAGLNIIE
jgi:hypothetical protein